MIVNGYGSKSLHPKFALQASTVNKLLLSVWAAFAPRLPAARLASHLSNYSTYVLLNLGNVTVP